MSVNLNYLIDPEQDPSKFNSAQQQEATKLRQAMKTQGLPDRFSAEDVHIRRDKQSGYVFISNKAKQMCMLNDGKIEIYYQCPKCGNSGFKNTLRHSSRCSEILW